MIFLFILLICRRINGFLSVQSILNSWDISHLVMFYHLFISDILLNTFMVCSWGMFVFICTYTHMYIHACVYVFIMIWGQGGVNSKPHTQVFGIFLLPLLAVKVCVYFRYFSCYSRLKLTHIQSSVVFAFVLPTSASTGRSSAPQAFSKVNQLYVSFCRCLSLLDTYTLLEVSILWWAQEALLFCILSFSHCSSGTIFLTFSVSWAERPL